MGFFAALSTAKGALQSQAAFYTFRNVLTIVELHNTTAITLPNQESKIP
jgi:hypothetical protein